MGEIRIKMLEVDLTNEKTWVLDVTEDVKNIRGLGTKLCWDLVPQGADALGPDNNLRGITRYLIAPSNYR